MLILIFISTKQDGEVLMNSVKTPGSNSSSLLSYLNYISEFFLSLSKVDNWIAFTGM
jgi:hypothetical protein